MEPNGYCPNLRNENATQEYYRLKKSLRKLAEIHLTPGDVRPHIEISFETFERRLSSHAELHPNETEELYKEYRSVLVSKMSSVLSEVDLTIDRFFDGYI